MNGKQFYEVEFVDTLGATIAKGIMTATEAICAARGHAIRFIGPIPAFEAWGLTPAQRGLPA